MTTQAAINEIALAVLEGVYDAAKRKGRLTAADLCRELERALCAIRSRRIERRAIHIFVTYDESALQTEFDRRMSPSGFPVGFSFDISDTDAGEETWAAAWQMAIEDVERNPPTEDYPTYDAAAVQAWLDGQRSGRSFAPPLAKPVSKHGAQMALVR